MHYLIAILGKMDNCFAKTTNKQSMLKPLMLFWRKGGIMAIQAKAKAFYSLIIRPTYGHILPHISPFNLHPMDKIHGNKLVVRKKVRILSRTNARFVYYPCHLSRVMGFKLALVRLRTFSSPLFKYKLISIYLVFTYYIYVNYVLTFQLCFDIQFLFFCKC